MIKSTSQIYFFRGLSAALLVASLGLSLFKGSADGSVVFLNQVNIIGSIFSILMTFELGRVYFAYGDDDSLPSRHVARIPFVLYVLLVLATTCGLRVYLNCSFIQIILGFVAGVLISTFNFISSEIAFSGINESGMIFVKSIFGFFASLVFFNAVYFWWGNPAISVLVLLTTLLAVVYLNRNYLFRIKIAICATPILKFSSWSYKNLFHLIMVALLAIAIVQIPRHALNHRGNELLVLISCVVTFMSSAFDSMVVSKSLRGHVTKEINSAYYLSRGESRLMVFAPFLTTAMALLLLLVIYGRAVDLRLGVIYLVFEFSRYFFTIGANGVGLGSSRSRLILLWFSFFLASTALYHLYQINY